MRTAFIKTVLIAAAMAGAYFMPLPTGGLDNALGQGLTALQDFVRQHAMYALAPALVLAGAITVLIRKPGMFKQSGSTASRARAYGLAGVAGAALSVCSCSVLPIFAGIRRMGAGIGPACTFLCAAPAINVLAVTLTAGVMGWQIGLARAIGAVTMGVITGLVMSVLFSRQDQPAPANPPAPLADRPARPAWKTAGVFAAMILAAVFLTWSPSGFTGLLRCCPDGKTSAPIGGQFVRAGGGSVVIRDARGETTVDAALVQDVRLDSPLAQRIYESRFILAGLAAIVLLAMAGAWLARDEIKEWAKTCWLFTLQILPMLLIGVLLSGVILGHQGKAGLLPSQWIASAVGGNSPPANLLAAVAGGLMYFATLTEVPIVQGLANAGMGHGPALAMLLAGPAVSLPSLLVLGSLMGARKTIAYAALVILLAATCGAIFGAIWP